MLIEESDHSFLGLPGKYFLHIKPHARAKEGESVHVIKKKKKKKIVLLFREVSTEKTGIPYHTGSRSIKTSVCVTIAVARRAFS